ncbi:MAG: hypothetical protein AB7F09_16495 [Parvibaculaceae bacterium]
MNRIAFSAGRHVTVAIVFLCMLALTLVQVLGPTARLNHAFGPADITDSAVAAVNERSSGTHNPLPSRCASIKLVPVEIGTIDVAPAEASCAFIATATFTQPHSTELGVPTPPPRRA